MVNNKKVNIKQCIKCQEIKKIDQFSADIKYKDGFKNNCKKCINAVRKIRYKIRYNTDLKFKEKMKTNSKKYSKKRCQIDYSFVEKKKEKSRFYHTGWTQQEYNETLKQQNGKCAICNENEISLYKGKIRALSADHCHKTGKKRGLLCNKCNKLLGVLDDNILKFQQIIEYLKKHSN